MEIAKLASKVESLVHGGKPVEGPPSSSGPTVFLLLQHSLNAGGSAGNPGSFPQGQGVGGSVPTPSAAAQAATIASLEQKFRLLDAKFVQLSTHSTSTTVKFGGAGFSSPRDVLPFIQAEMPIAYYGCFVNAAILLKWIQGNVGDDTLKNMETMRKLKIPSLAEVHALKGLEAALPRLLGNVITSTGRQNTTFYTRVPTASVWTNGSTGTKEFILGSLAAVVSAVWANIDQRLPHGKQLHTLA